MVVVMVLMLALRWRTFRMTAVSAIVTVSVFTTDASLHSAARLQQSSKLST